MTTTQEMQAWEALKRLGDTALERGGVQAVLQMFVSVLTSAEQVAQESEAAGNPDEMAAAVISTWLTSTYVPDMLEALTQTPP
jgi:DMSO reductase anchor subunit